MHAQTKNMAAIGFFAVLALVCTLAFTACSGSTSSAGQSSSVETGGSQDASVASAEVDVLKPADVAGYWVVDESKGASLNKLLGDGILMAYKFDKKGTFDSILYITDELIKRSGTYRIKDGKLIVNLPKSVDKHVVYRSFGVQLSGGALKDVEIEVDGDRWTSQSMSNDGSVTSAKKVTAKEFKEYVKQVKSLAPKKPAIGETVDAGPATFTINSFEYVDEIYPSDTSSYYLYMEHKDGKSYLLANVTFTNDGTEFTNPGQSTKASFDVGGNKYDGVIAVDQGNTFGEYYSVEAKDTAQLYIYCSVPDTARDAGNATLTWSIPNSESYMRSYYRDIYPHEDYVITL